MPSRLKRWGWKRFAAAVGLTAFEMVQFWIWDVWHGVETRNQVPIEKLGIEGACYGENPQEYVYSGWNGDYTCAAWNFPKILKGLNLDWTSFTYLDLGCGKGKSLLMAAELPFSRVLGVELSPELVSLAQKNLSTRRNFNLKCEHIEIIFQDATAYAFPPSPLVIYLLNTFPPAIMRSVLENLKRSLEEHPREVYILCIPTPPEIESVFSQSGFLQEVNPGRGYKAYRAFIAHRAGHA